MLLILFVESEIIMPSLVLSRLFINILNKTGPSIKPFATLKIIDKGSEMLKLALTDCVLLSR